MDYKTWKAEFDAARAAERIACVKAAIRTVMALVQ